MAAVDSCGSKLRWFPEAGPILGRWISKRPAAIIITDETKTKRLKSSITPPLPLPPLPPVSLPIRLPSPAAASLPSFSSSSVVVEDKNDGKGKAEEKKEKEKEKENEGARENVKEREKNSEERHYGVIRAFNPLKNMGFIQSDSYSGNIFVHGNDLMVESYPTKSKKRIETPQRVEFTLAPGKPNPKAIRVTGPNNTLVIKKAEADGSYAQPYYPYYFAAFTS